MKKIPLSLLVLMDMLSFILLIFISKKRLDFIFLTRSWKSPKNYKVCGSTPQYISSIMANTAMTKYGANCNLNILEPGFGEGSILREIDHWFHNCLVKACEIDKKMYDNFPVLSRSNNTFYLYGDFFDRFTEADENTFDVILMNPPFENNEYIRHIFIAYQLLKIGGVMVFLFPKSHSYRCDCNSINFREFLVVNEAEVNDIGDAICSYPVSVCFGVIKKKTEDELRINRSEVFERRLYSKRLYPEPLY